MGKRLVTSLAAGLVALIGLSGTLHMPTPRNYFSSKRDSVDSVTGATYHRFGISKTFEETTPKKNSTTKSFEKEEKERMLVPTNISTYEEVGGACGLAAADFNDDGLVDLVVGSQEGVRIFERSPHDPYLYIRSALDQDQLASVSVMKQDTKGGACGLAAGDVSGDGRADIVVGNLQGITFYKQRLAVSFWPQETDNPWDVQNRGSHGGASGLALFDFDQDGKLELVIGDRHKVGIYTIEKNFELRRTSFVHGPIFSEDSKGYGVCGIGAGDLNGNRRAEIVVGDLDGVSVYHIRQGAYHKVPHISFDDVTVRPGKGGACGIAIGDATGNGWNDIFIGDTKSVRLYRNTGNGNISRKPQKLSFMEWKEK